METKMQTNKREKWVDAIKGFAILCVVLGHTLDGVVSRGLYVEADKVLSYLFDLIYAFHMPLFMTISGLVFYKAYIKDGKARREKINKQIINLICLYLMYCLAYGLMKLAFSAFVNSDVGIKDVLMIPIRPIGPYWYLYALIALYLIFSLELINKINDYIMLVVLFAMSIAGRFVDINDVLGISRIMVLAFFFFMGKIITKHLEKHGIAISILFVTAVVLFNVFYGNYDSEIQYSIMKSCIAFGMTIGICFIAYLLKNVIAKNNGLGLCYIGEHSLEIYVLHVFFVTGLNVAFDKMHILGIVGLLLTFVISAVMPIVCGLIFKRIKLYNLLFKPATYLTSKTKDKGELHEN